MFARAFKISQGFENKELVKELEIDLVLKFVKNNIKG